MWDWVLRIIFGTLSLGATTVYLFVMYDMIAMLIDRNYIPDWPGQGLINLFRK